jgi:hypothetical protein
VQGTSRFAARTGLRTTLLVVVLLWSAFQAPVFFHATFGFLVVTRIGLGAAGAPGTPLTQHGVHSGSRTRGSISLQASWLSAWFEKGLGFSIADAGKLLTPAPIVSTAFLIASSAGATAFWEGASSAAGPAAP